MTDDLNAIAAKVRGIRAEEGLTQEEFAAIAGIERKAVVARDGGKTPWAGTEILRLANGLRRPVSDFYPAPQHAPSEDASGPSEGASSSSAVA